MIQDHHCFPLPNFPPTPNLNRGSIFPSAPPVESKTSPVLIFTTLVFVARSAAASHCLQTAAKKSSPGRSDSLTALFPVSPYQPIALAEIKTSGLRFETALAIVVVPRSREFNISARYLLVHLLSPTFAPAR